MTVDRTQPLEVAWMRRPLLRLRRKGRGEASGWPMTREGHPPDPFVGPFDMGVVPAFSPPNAGNWTDQGASGARSTYLAQTVFSTVSGYRGPLLIPDCF